MDISKVELQFLIGEQFWGNKGVPLKMEVPIEEGESLRSLLNRLAGQVEHFAEAVFDPQTQRLSSEATILLNDHLWNLSQGLETNLKNGDHILFLPILTGG
jgi:molybdopterin converting factor small subunit